MSSACRTLCSFLAIALIGTPCVVVGQAGIPGSQQPARGCTNNRPIPPISQDAEQVASAIGVLPLVQRVRTLASDCGPPGVISTEELTLRQQVGEAVLTSPLDLDGVVTEVDVERAQILELREQLSGKRDHKVNVLTLASFIIGTGSGVVGTTMQFGNSLAKPGDWIQSAGSRPDEISVDFPGLIRPTYPTVTTSS